MHDSVKFFFNGSHTVCCVDKHCLEDLRQLRTPHHPSLSLSDSTPGCPPYESETREKGGVL